MSSKTENTKKTFKILARCGYVARAMIYFAFGGFALMALIPGGSGGDTTSTKQALGQIQSIPFGGTLLAITGLGLLMFSIWRIVQAIADPDERGTDGKAIAVRTGYALSSIIHASLGIFALRATAYLSGSASSSSGGGSSKQGWASQVMSYPGGEWVVMLAGVVLIAYGLSQFYKAYSESFTKHIAMPRNSWSMTFSKIGLSARGASFLIISGFVIYAGWTSQAGQVTGTGGVWRFLSHQPFGQTLMIIMALGFICFGIYNVLEARYRRIGLT